MKKRFIMPDLSAATHWINQKTGREQLLGAPALIHFWSIHCSKCKKSFPVVASIREKYKGRLNVVAVHMPLASADLDVRDVAQTAAQYALTEPMLIDNTHQIADQFSNRFVPAYYLFAPDGHLIEYYMGERGVYRIAKTIDALFHL